MSKFIGIKIPVLRYCVPLICEELSNSQTYWNTGYQYTNTVFQGTAALLGQLVNGFHVNDFVEGTFFKMIPPLEQEIVHDQSEPRRQLQTFISSICFPQQLF